MNVQSSQDSQPASAAAGRSITMAAGAMLVLIGLLSLLDRSLDTGWLPSAGLTLAGIVFIVDGKLARREGEFFWGWLLLGGGIGGLLALHYLSAWTMLQRMGAFSMSFGIGWILAALISPGLTWRPAWWALVPGSSLFAFGACLLFTPAGPFHITLYLLSGAGLALLAWGMGARLFGLIIPGCLSLTIGPGIYTAWGRALPEMNALSKTGMMLVVFAFGWGLIVLFSKRITDGFVWWPLIPGGVLAVVGWGLYIAGRPGNAMGFITNTGSVGLIIFGLYLLLLRRGLHR